MPNSPLRFIPLRASLRLGPSRSVVPAALLALVLSGCGDDSATSGAGGSTPEPESCDGHAVGGPAQFSRQTERWGLVGVVGGRVSTGDVNGDGYPDLFVHGFAPNVREVKGGEARRVFLLMNEPAEGGGRRFVDRTYESGFAVPADGSTTELKSSHLAVLADVDNDGDLDVFSGTYSDAAAPTPTPADLDRSEIYLNDGTGKFTRKEGSGVQFERARRTSSASFTDIDVDGVIDLFVGVHYSASGALQAPALYRGNGDGSFGEVTQGAGITTTRRATFGATSCDLDDDGVPELLMSAYARGPNVILKRNADGTYADVAVDAGAAYDDEQDYTDNQFFRCWCTVNGTSELCTNVPPPAVGCPSPPGSYWSPTTETEPGRLGGNTFSTVCADVDGDGRLDLYNAEIVHWWAGSSSDLSNLLVQNGEAGAIGFERVDRTARGLDWPRVGADWNEGGIVAAAADLDGDGRREILAGASDYPDQYAWIFQQQADGRFLESSKALGIDHPCAVGLAVADFDRDGDLDVVVASGTARDCAQIWPANEVHLYENTQSERANAIAVRLRGKGAGAANVAGIGARVTVEAGGVRQLGVVDGGHGHFGMQHDTTLHFGLGACQNAATIEVVWPDSTRSTQRFERVPGSRLVEITQGEDAPRTLVEFAR